jgi:hypothetical protein
MSAGPDTASVGNAIPSGAISTASPQSFNPSTLSRPEGHPVVLSPEQLRLHRALEELGWVGAIDEFNDARPTHSSVAEPILVTTGGTILSGFGRWRSALFDGRLEINCIDYQLDEDESLAFILTHQQMRRGWNAFVRIRLALALEPNLQQRALDNMRTGGKLKGLPNLPDAHHI